MSDDAATEPALLGPDPIAPVGPDLMAPGTPVRVRTAWGLLLAAPVATGILLIGVALTLVAFVGVRGLEHSRAEVEYDRTVLEQTTEVQQRLTNHINKSEELASTLSLGPMFTSRVFEGFFESGGHFGQRLQFDGIVVVEQVVGTEGFAALRDREIANENPGFAYAFNPLGVEDALVITRRFGEVLDEAPTGSRLDPVLSSWVEQSAVQGSTVVQIDAEASQLFPLADPEATENAGYQSLNGLVLVTPIYTAGDEPTLRAAVLSRIDLGDLLQSVQGNDELVALDLLVGDKLAASTVAEDERGRAISESAQFSVGGETIISVQGYRTGFDTPRNQSNAVLTGGLALSFVLAWVGRATRQHALTLGRLERSEHDARHDVLTGLLNRAGLTIALSHRVEDRRPPELVGVLFLDLDRLKIINDSIGHTAGDEVLAFVSNHLRRVTQPADIIGRFGGDEFVIVPADARSVRDLTRLADAIIEALSEPCVLSDRSLQIVSASIGIAWVADGEASAESMLRDADVAMYRAKDAGGNRWVVFDADLRAQALARLEVERELRKAITEGQLEVHYQPIVSTTDGMVDKLEALVRWRHPVRGLIPPGQFLSVAEETGLIVEVGELVLRDACKQAAKWSAQVGRSISVSVNVAERQLIDPGLVKTVRSTLTETGLNAEQLELEITEELIIERLDHRLTILRRLSRMGVKLAIDDFGTGRASLSQLRHLEMVDTLKVDRAFVENVASNETDQKILTAIVALAQSVGMETVAEGVEDADQATKIKENGVDSIQGFYFMRPSPSHDIVPVLRTPFELPWSAQQSFLLS
ncbi:MAG: EAL domain-containing protein [Acidimicrobiales bacterium]|nr:EAL domain-containing protein [Acidimicrobiales bacterium]